MYIIPQQKHDEERGITPQRVIEFVLVEKIGGPPEVIVEVAQVMVLTLKEFGFEISQIEKAVSDGG